MSHLSIWCVPALVLYAWMIIEFLHVAARRGERPDARRWTTAGILAMRPWAVWAVFNLFCRWQVERGFGHVTTFPFYAVPWREGVSGGAVLRELAATREFWSWSLLVLLLAALFVRLAWSVLRLEDTRSRARLGYVMALLPVVAFVYWTAMACLPRGVAPRSPRDPGSYLLVWHSASSTLIYAMPQVRGEARFVRDFEQIQPSLRRTIHGLSHPPGAVLSLHWIGRMMGAEGRDIRQNETKMRYALGLTAVAALNVLAVGLLGSLVFGCVRTGFLAAVLWTVAPATTAYATFAQDLVYALFFHLALAGTWRMATSERPPVVSAVLLGIVFFVLTMLTYSWCIMTAVFAVFTGLIAVKRRWRRREAAMRIVVPLGVMTVLSGGLFAVYDLNYLAAYRVARDYHEEWYRFETVYQWGLALFGGQLELFLMMGSVAGSVFLETLRRFRSACGSEARLFLLVLLGVYALPVVFGPNPLKMETARCWLWMVAPAIVFVAHALARHRDGAFLAGATVAASVTASFVMRLFVDFGA